jgi:hypothetical protein
MYKKHWHIQKTSAHPKSVADGKNSAHRKILVSNVGTREKLGARQGWRAAEELPYFLGSAESATSDFSHAPLMVSFSSLQMC